MASPRDEYDEDDLDPRDAVYERYGNQGLGLSTYAATHWRRGVSGWTSLGIPATPQSRLPRGYRRSDERIREDVCERLTASGDVDATDIDVTVRDGVVTLGGDVADRATKVAAEEVAESVSGVVDVANELRIARRS